MWDSHVPLNEYFPLSKPPSCPSARTLQFSPCVAGGLPLPPRRWQQRATGLWCTARDTGGSGGALPPPPALPQASARTAQLQGAAARTSSIKPIPAKALLASAFPLHACVLAERPDKPHRQHRSWMEPNNQPPAPGCCQCCRPPLPPAPTQDHARFPLPTRRAPRSLPGRCLCCRSVLPEVTCRSRPRHMPSCREAGLMYAPDLSESPPSAASASTGWPRWARSMG